MSDEFVVDSTKALALFRSKVNELFTDHHYVTFTWIIGKKKRTLTQNASIWLYCNMLADALNDAGYERVISSPVLSKAISLPWGKTSVKEAIWHTVQLALTGEESSADIGTKEVSLIYDVINRHISETFGITVPFPSKDDSEPRSEK